LTFRIFNEAAFGLSLEAEPKKESRGEGKKSVEERVSGEDEEKGVAFVSFHSSLGVSTRCSVVKLIRYGIFYEKYIIPPIDP
jgi:hypothetical protein